MHGIIVQSDKTMNLYILDIPLYDSLQEKKIIKKYKVVSKKRLDNFNIISTETMIKYGIDNRTETYIPGNPRITTNDHKDHFYSNTQVRLIQVGWFQVHLDNYINKLDELGNHKLWNCTRDTIKWFYSITDNRCKFLQIYTENYYSSINEIILNRDLLYAMSKVNITFEKFKVILAVTKTIMVYNDKWWVWKNTKDYFYILMGPAYSTKSST